MSILAEVKSGDAFSNKEALELVRLLGFDRPSKKYLSLYFVKERGKWFSIVKNWEQLKKELQEKGLILQLAEAVKFGDLKKKRTLILEIVSVISDYRVRVEEI